MRVLSIDPGYERLGIAVIEGAVGKERVVYSDCVRTDKKFSHGERLKIIGREIEKVIKKYQPEHLAIETLFLETNHKTAMKVSEARGVMLYEASGHKLEIYEYTPLQIKVAVTGYGKSTKDGVIGMVKKLVKIEKKKALDDEYDAIAVGLTHFACYRDTNR